MCIEVIVRNISVVFETQCSSLCLQLIGTVRIPN